MKQGRSSSHGAEADGFVIAQTSAVGGLLQMSIVLPDVAND